MMVCVSLLASINLCLPVLQLKLGQFVYIYGGDRWRQVGTGGDRWRQMGTGEDRWGPVCDTYDREVILDLIAL